jgi:hypothetical protein
MQEKQSNPKKYIDFMNPNQTPILVDKSKIPLKFYLGGVPRKKLIVPQNFWVNSPLGFWGKIILLAMSLFFGLTIMAIFMGEILNILLK